MAPVFALAVKLLRLRLWATLYASESSSSASNRREPPLLFVLLRSLPGLGPHRAPPPWFYSDSRWSRRELPPEISFFCSNRLCRCVSGSGCGLSSLAPPSTSALDWRHHEQRCSGLGFAASGFFESPPRFRGVTAMDLFLAVSGSGFSIHHRESPPLILIHRFSSLNNSFDLLLKPKLKVAVPPFTVGLLACFIIYIFFRCNHLALVENHY